MSDDTTPIYYRVSPALWRNRSWTDDMRLLACYLLTSPHRTLEGLFILPKGYIFGDLQWSDERLAEPCTRLQADGFLAYDEGSEVCLIVKALKYQAPSNPNMDTSAIRRLVAIPETSLDLPFFTSAERYAERFAKQLRERLHKRFGKPQLLLYSALLSSTQCAREDELPVDNSAGQERGSSIEPEEQQPPASPPATSCEPCDGSPCQVRDFPAAAMAPLKRAFLKSLKPGRWSEVGTGGALDDLLDADAGTLCGCCQVALAEFERPDREGLCENAVVAAVEGLVGVNDVEAVMRSRLSRCELADHIGDRALEELRRSKRSRGRKSEPKPIGTTLAPEFAGPMVRAPADDEAAS